MTGKAENGVISNRFGLTGFQLKWIAMISMAIDHMGMVLFPGEMIFRILGRLAFPIYCFLLVEGAVHTKNPVRYLGRLLVFALLSEIPFDLVCFGKVFDLSGQNVFFTLLLGLLAVILLQSGRFGTYDPVIVLFLALAAEWCNTDYGFGGIVIILVFFILRQRPWAKCISFAAADILIYGGIRSVQSYGILALIPIWCYNGKRGLQIKYLFYVFYPLHLLVLYWLKIFVSGS